MKTILFLLAFIPMICKAQCIITSTTGYQVHIIVEPISLQIQNNGGGCTYKVLLQYSIDFTGNNQPGNLYTLQGNIGCGNQNPFFDIPQTEGSGFAYSVTASYNGDCSTLNVSNLCNDISIFINGPGISSQTVNCSFSKLPVSLISFEAMPGKLEWLTGSEMDNDYFIIEQSTTGDNWGTIGTVKSYGNSSITHGYYFEIPEPVQVLTYYRLSQVGINGNVHTFNDQIVFLMPNEKGQELSFTNTLGQPVDKSYHGIVITRYSSGKTAIKIQ